MSDLPSPPFSAAMPMGNTSLNARGNKSLTLDRREILLESKLQASKQEAVSLLNTCIREENQGRLESDKELKILGKSLKMQMKENKYLSLKLCQKKKN